MTTQTMPVAEYNDAGLVTESLAGNRDAFGQIVAHHQSLICSLAYSATGSLTQSEDLAQETFVTAWKHLPELREPAKLRAWLCGIARNLIGKALRRDGREPVHAAEPLEAANEPPSQEPLPPDHLMSKEEEAILWRSLERIPETYREPLVLFYREHQSVERVAEALELTPGRRQATAFARAQAAARTGAGVCGRGLGANESGQSVHSGCAGGLAGDGHLGQGSRRRSDCGQRRRRGEVGRFGRVVQRSPRTCYRSS